MNLLARTSLIALALAGAPLAAQSAPAGGFRLPTPTPTATDIQGPVDPDAPILTRPRDNSPAPVPTPTPRPTAVPTTAPPQRAIVLPAPQPAASPTTRAVPTRAGSPTPATAQPADADAGAATIPSAPGGSAIYPPVATPTSTASASVPAAPPAGDSGIPGWLYALGGLLVGAGAVAAFMWRRRNSAEIEPAVIERPRVAPAPAAAAPVSQPPLGDDGPRLAIEARALRMSRSMMFATLSYEVLVTNRGSRPLAGVRLGADLVTAHARIPTDQQLADPLVPLNPVKTFDQLGPGQAVTFAGELRLPVAEIRPIPHGKAVVYVPLLRVRAEAEDLIPVARTFVVGLPGGVNQRLQPFRLDEMPQTYRSVSQHALD